MTETIDLSGIWEGTYAYSGDDVEQTEFRLRLKDENGQLRGLVVEPHTEQSGNRRAEIEGVCTDRTINFVKKYIPDDDAIGQPPARPISYEGVLSADGTSISGSWFLPDDRGSFAMDRAD